MEAAGGDDDVGDAAATAAAAADHDAAAAAAAAEDNNDSMVGMTIVYTERDIKHKLQSITTLITTVLTFLHNPFHFSGHTYI